jgi:integrase
MAEDRCRRIVVWVQSMGDRPHLTLQWHDPVTGQRRSKSAQTCNPLDAEKARADLEYELNHGLYQEGSRMAWETFRATFEHEYVAALCKNSRRNYQATLNSFERACRPGRIDLVTARTVSAFAAAMRSADLPRGKRGMEPTTIKMRLRFLYTTLRWAVEQGLLAKCPPFPKVKVPDKKPQPVPAESFERLLARAPDAQLRAYLLCGWLAGLRLEEAFNLEWQESETVPYLDLARDRIILPGGAVKGKRDQWVPLDPELRKVLESLPRHGRRVFRFVGWRGRPLSLKGVSKCVTRLAREAGVKLTMKTLRRGFGCRYAGKVPAQVLQKLMRHSTIKTTMDYYANVDDAVEEAVLGKKEDREAALNSIRSATRNIQPHCDPAAGDTDGATLNSEVT